MLILFSFSPSGEVSKPIPLPLRRGFQTYPSPSGRGQVRAFT